VPPSSWSFKNRCELYLFRPGFGLSTCLAAFSCEASLTLKNTWAVAPHVVEAVLNHKSGQVRGVAAVYNRYSYSAEKREALNLWAEHVERCAGNITIARPVEAAIVEAAE
jgi:hypothetical protein